MTKGLLVKIECITSVASPAVCQVVRLLMIVVYIVYGSFVICSGLIL